MWFIKLRIRYYLWRIGKLDSTEYRPNRKQCEQLLQLIEPKLFEKYLPIIGTGFEMQPLYPSIDEYSKAISNISALVQRNKTLAPITSEINSTTIVMDRWFITKDNFYTDIKYAIEVFKQAGLLLCTAMQPADTETHGIYEYNLRMTAKLFVNLHATTLALIQLSLKL